ncbi:hypothetical protein PsorP6_001800 [Peronosclerospora sorghi]|uniref:Uncharacterized protein n=1 Tax=Peronosclerospora sorghi TaxID=230839 RepID=A0ACC0WRG7_9STRA|nr:hypothetical protein PsorP6_001800 [Peronosclerospora sorghi]
MITSPLDVCESTMLYAKVHVQVDLPCAQYHSGSVDKSECRKTFARRGAVGRRFAIVALPVDVTAAIASTSDLQW